MKLITRPWSTPLVIASSVIVTVSGVMMFFHLGDELVKGAHEWLGLLFAGGMLLHILNHWPAFKRYFSQRMAVVIMSVVMLAGSGFIAASAMNEGKHPVRLVVDQVLELPLSRLALMQDRSLAEIEQVLATAGIKASAESSLEGLAQSNQRHPFELVELLFVQESVR